MLTRQQFIEAHFHELSGIILDAALAGRSGAELSIWLRNTQKKLSEKLGKVFDDLQPKAANGAAISQPVRKT